MWNSEHVMVAFSETPPHQEQTWQWYLFSEHKQLGVDGSQAAKLLFKYELVEFLPESLNTEAITEHWTWNSCWRQISLRREPIPSHVSHLICLPIRCVSLLLKEWTICAKLKRWLLHYLIFCCKKSLLFWNIPRCKLVIMLTPEVLDHVVHKLR